MPFRTKASEVLRWDQSSPSAAEGTVGQRSVAVRVEGTQRVLSSQGTEDQLC